MGEEGQHLFGLVTLDEASKPTGGVHKAPARDRPAYRWSLESVRVGPRDHPPTNHGELGRVSPVGAGSNRGVYPSTQSGQSQSVVLFLTFSNRPDDPSRLRPLEALSGRAQQAVACTDEASQPALAGRPLVKAPSDGTRHPLSHCPLWASAPR